MSEKPYTYQNGGVTGYDCRPGHGTPLNMNKIRTIRVISDARKTYTPGWTVTEPDGHVVDKADGPVAAELHLSGDVIEKAGL